MTNAASTGLAGGTYGKLVQDLSATGYDAVGTSDSRATLESLVDLLERAVARQMPFNNLRTRPDY